MVKRNLHELRQAGSRERASLCLCKIRGLCERVQYGDLTSSGQRWSLGKASPSTERLGMGEGIGLKKEHGWKVMWQKTQNFGSQMYNLEVQECTPGGTFLQAVQAFHFFNKSFLSTKVCLRLFQVLGIQQLMCKMSFPCRACFWWVWFRRVTDLGQILKRLDFRNAGLL